MKDLKILLSVIPVTIFIIIFYAVWQLVGFYYKSNFNNKFQTPLATHYESNVFRVPDWLSMPKGASITATTTNEPMIKLPIIMFHYVEYVKDVNDYIRRSLTIDPYTFEQQLISLRDNGYKTYFVKEIPDIFAKKVAYTPKSVVLTFDDGYEDFYTDVFPLLKKYQMKATLYIISDFIGRYQFLKVDQIKELAASGLVEIGAHTLDHVYLKSISSLVAQEQIIQSKKDLEKMLGIEVKTFAYPYGAFEKETLDLVKEASYSAAVSVISGISYTPTNILYLPRIRAGMVASANMVPILESMTK